MGNRVNPRIHRWLSEGRVTDAILGSPGFFVPDNTYVGEHDLTLVMSQLLQWA